MGETNEEDSASSAAPPSNDQLLEDLHRQFVGWPDPVARLHEALSHNELTLYMQPVLDLQNGGHFAMAEVLVRLQEEEKALLPPGDFLPVFEHYRMMPDLDRWVVGKVVQLLMHGSRIPRLTINVSSQSLDDPGFARFIADALIAAALPPSSLVFEIDEPAMLDRLEAAARFANSVKAIGCGVLIDGFGGRAVSFVPLKVLRADFLKVDGRIVPKLLHSSIARTKLSTIVRLGKTIGLGIVAETVEEQDILLQLKALGVGYAQGHGICRPYPMAAPLGSESQLPLPAGSAGSPPSATA